MLKEVAGDILRTKGRNGGARCGSERQLCERLSVGPEGLEAGSGAKRSQVLVPYFRESAAHSATHESPRTSQSAPKSYRH